MCVKTLPTKAQTKAFIEYSLIWYSEQFAIPFWVVGHVHLHLTNYHDTVDLLGSITLHLMVGTGFWLGFRRSQQESQSPPD
jgi:hypothetical protein